MIATVHKFPTTHDDEPPDFEADYRHACFDYLWAAFSRMPICIVREKAENIRATRVLMMMARERERQ